VNDDYVWTFSRGEETLELRRRKSTDGFLLVIRESTGERSYFFPEIAALMPFQSDMETFLLNTGWSFVHFSPERRAGRDRRQWPRLTERRRWWTDGRHEPATPPRRRRR